MADNSTPFFSGLGGLLHNGWDLFNGNPSQSTQDPQTILGSVKPIDPSVGQISGLGAYQQAMQDLDQGVNTAQGQVNTGLQGINANNSSLGQYLQSVAMGQQPSAANQMMQNQTANMNAQNQSNMVTNGGGMNPAMAMRQMYNNNAQNQSQMGANMATQKANDMSQYSNMAMQNLNQQAGLQQQQYQNALSSAQLQGNMQNSVLGANAQQTGYNVGLAQNSQALQQWLAQQQMGLSQQTASNNAAGAKGLLQNAASAAGMALGMGGGGGGGLGGMMGGAMGNGPGNMGTNTFSPVSGSPGWSVNSGNGSVPI